jgi:hypothetical protein
VKKGAMCLIGFVSGAIGFVINEKPRNLLRGLCFIDLIFKSIQ